MKPHVVLASGNTGKLKEFAALLEPLRMTVSSQAEHGVTPAEETGLTFVENALIKARHAAATAGLPAIADDSGLVVPALGGAPGIYSARYAGVEADDARNNAKLIADLEGIDAREAYFYCAIVMMRDALDPTPLISCAAWHGKIVDTPRGTQGFGYDPHFLVPTLNATSAELPRDEKNALSHRGQAVQGLLEQLSERHTFAQGS